MHAHAKTIETPRAPHIGTRPDKDEHWEPLHPMHADLATRLSAFPPPQIKPYPGAARVVIAVGLAGAAWAVLIVSVQTTIGLISG